MRRGTRITSVGRDPATGGLVIAGTSEGEDESEGEEEGGAPEAFELRPQSLVSQVGYRPSYDLARELQVLT